MTQPTKPAPKPAKPKAAAKSHPHPKATAAVSVPAPKPVSLPAKGLAVLSVASGLIGAAVFGLVRRGR